MTFRGRDVPPSLYSTNYPLRLFVLARAIVIGCIAMFEDASINHTLLVTATTSPLVGLTAMGLLIAVGVGGFFDAVINDMLPRQFRVRWMVEYRHIGFLVLATIDLGITLIVVSRGYFGTALLALLLDAAAAVWVAIYHIRHRYVVPRARVERWRARSTS